MSQKLYDYTLFKHPFNVLHCDFDRFGEPTAYTLEEADNDTLISVTCCFRINTQHRIREK